MIYNLFKIGTITGLICMMVLFLGVPASVYAGTDPIDPDGDGTTLQGTQTTCGAGGHYDCVNDAVRSPTAPSTSGDYVTLASSKEDIYTVATVGGIGQATTVQVFVYHQESKTNMQFALHLWNAAESVFLAPAQNVANRTSAAWDSATFSGLSLSQSQLDDMRVGIFCEKTGTGASGLCNAYAVYVVVTYDATALTQNDFRFYVNQDDLLTPTNDPWPEGSNDLDENKEIPPGFSMGQFKTARIRMNVAVSGFQMATSTQDFKLQYVVLTAPSCGEQGSGWADVGARFSTSEDFRFFANPFADTATISTTLLSSSHVGGSYSELNPTPTNPNVAAIGKNVEYDWPVQLVVSSGQDYCFRMVKSSGALLDAYLSDSFPKLRTKSLGGGSEGDGPPPPASDVGGGDEAGGGEVGEDPGAIVGFSPPLATGEDFFAWINAASAYASDNSNASALLGSLQQDYYNFGLGVPEGNIITGIEFKIEASTSGSGEIQVALSHDGGATYTTVPHTTGALTGSDVIYTVGSGGDLWGKASWSASEISNVNFRMRVTSSSVVDAVRIDHIQAKVHHITSGGGAGGGGETFRWNPFQFFARIFSSVVALFSL